MIFYRILCLFFTPAYVLLALFRIARGKDVAARISERFGIATTVAHPFMQQTDKQQSRQGNQDRRLIWVHAASVGETLSVLGLVERIRNAHPHAHVLMTSYTKTAAQIIAKKNIDGVVHQFLPYDHPVFVWIFLRFWRPDAVIWVESEFWPELLTQIKSRKILAALVNLRFSKRSYNRWKRFAPAFIRARLSAFGFFHAQSEEYQIYIEDLSGRKADMIGNLKDAAPPLAYDKGALERLRAATAPRPAIVYASTHKGEEEQFVRVHTALAKAHPDLIGIIVPRHPDRGGKVLDIVTQAGLRGVRRSVSNTETAPDTIPSGTDMYIADTLGELGLFYKLCPIAVIGNSFVHTPGGGHNPLEAAHLECCIVYGPSMYNFKEMEANMNAAEAALQVRDEAHLCETLGALLSAPDRVAKYAARAQAFALKGQDVQETLYNHLKARLNLS